jgi:ABC-type glycerol-3-phosphate transport system permease component
MTTAAQPSSAAYLSAVPVVRRVRKNRFQQFFFFSLMLLFTLIWLIPLFSALYTSIRVQGDLTRNGFWSLPARSPSATLLPPGNAAWSALTWAIASSSPYHR